MVCVQWAGGSGGNVNSDPCNTTVKAFASKVAARFGVDVRRLRLAWNGEVLVDPACTLADYGVSHLVYALISLGSDIPGPIASTSSVDIGDFLPHAAIKRLDSAALGEINKSNRARLLGFPALSDVGMSAITPAPNRNVYDILFEGKIYALKLMVGLSESVSTPGKLCYSLAGSFDELPLLVEKNLALHHGIKDYGRILREALLEDAANCGLLWPSPAVLEDMEAVQEKLANMEEEAAEFYCEDSSVYKWVPVLILLPVLLLSDEELEMEGKTPLEDDNEHIVDSLCSLLVGDDSQPRAFVVTWRLNELPNKTGFQLLSEFAKDASPA